jgi:hypothetical protein
MAVSGAGPSESGLASALLNVGQQIGGSIGIALLGTIAATTTKNQLAGGQLAVNVATAAGYAAGFILASGIALLAFLVAVVIIRGRKPLRVAREVTEHAA